MASDLAGLKTALKAAQDQALTDCQTAVPADTVRQNYVDNYADAVLEFVKTADLTIPIGGIVVSGSATTQSNTAALNIADGLS